MVSPFWSAATAVMMALAVPTGSSATPRVVAQTANTKSRLIVLTDIGAEVDDQESLVRLLVYSNEIDIEGLIAATSTFLRDKVHPELIVERVRAYGQVRRNLEVHAHGYPQAETLLGEIRAGRAEYGMSGVGDGKETEASRLIIHAVDRPDPRPVWISIWGGATDLAQALWTVRATRSPEEVARFVSKLRVYSISDQDDVGPWARANFPTLIWIGSLKDVKQAGTSAWIGMSAPFPGADPAPVGKAWIATNIQSKGPLGALYPTPKYLMEGDSPAFLSLIRNGLSSPEHPDWGGWGGRYARIDPIGGAWGEVSDTVIGTTGAPVTSHAATVWRWRAAYQNDFAARMDWTVRSRFTEANHAPDVKLNGVAGDAALQLSACPGQAVRLSARGSIDPDGQALSYRWWWYREPGGEPSPTVTITQDNGLSTTVAVTGSSAVGRRVHIILEATDSGTPPITGYRRAILTIRTADACRRRSDVRTEGPTSNPSRRFPTSASAARTADLAR